MNGFGYVFLAGIVLLVIARGLTPGADRAKQDQGADVAIAVNFIAYRNAVDRVALSEKPESGVIGYASLELPAGWKALRTWSNGIEAGVCYVYGPGSAPEARAIAEMLGSLAIGRNVSGSLFNAAGYGVVLPGWIPEGSIVSAIGIPEE